MASLLTIDETASCPTQKISNSNGLTYSPEYVIMLRTMSNLESGFLARSLNRMYEPINAAFPAYGGASKVPPGRTENLLIVRAISR
jgi:hypothetical protein